MTCNMMRAEQIRFTLRAPPPKKNDIKGTDHSKNEKAYPKEYSKNLNETNLRTWTWEFSQITRSTVISMTVRLVAFNFIEQGLNLEYIFFNFDLLSPIKTEILKLTL